jgi:threonine synthase
MHITQPAGNSPIVKAFEADETRVRPVKPNTIAKSLAIGNPADGLYALQTVRESSGAATAVPEDDIVNGIKLLAQTEGIFTETAGGVAISGLKRLVERGAIKRDEPTVVFVTGNGLKTLEAVEDVAQPISIAPTIASFEEALGGA